MNPGMALRLE
jgi:hypothetical protein